MKYLQSTIAVLALTVACSASATAEIYVGGALGQARIDERIDGLRIADNSTSWRVFAGYEFNDYIGLEAGYLDLGNISDTVLGVPVRADADGWTLSAVGRIPFADRWAVQAKAGFFFWDGQSSVNGVVERDPGDQNPFVGIGIAYRFNENVQLDVGVDYYDMDDVQPLIGAMALSFRF
ncbi:MAG: outer membrane beta-barrel protein [Gammaproteobacteria bacterium]|nr:outer membrane beta-barrel protein [Gammaproteobacteria bacterium]